VCSATRLTSLENHDPYAESHQLGQVVAELTLELEIAGKAGLRAEGLFLDLLGFEGVIDDQHPGLLQFPGHLLVQPLLVDDDPHEDLVLRAHLGHHGVHELPVPLAQLLDPDHPGRGHNEVGDVPVFPAGHEGHLVEKRVVKALDRHGHPLQGFHGPGQPQAQALDDPGHGHALHHLGHTLGQERAGHDGSRGRPVADLLLLGLGRADDHPGRRVRGLYLRQDGNAVVGDDHVPVAVHQHGVEALGPERAFDRGGDGLDSVGVGDEGRQLLVDL